MLRVSSAASSAGSRPDDFRELQKDSSAVDGRCARPVAVVERAPGGGDRLVDVLRGGVRNVGDDFAGRRIDDGARLGAGTRHKRAVDKQRGRFRHDGAWINEVVRGTALSLLDRRRRAEVLHLILLDVAIVLIESAREGVGAVVAADEIQIVGVGRVSRGVERCLAGRGNRTGRQSRIAIRVVRRVEGQIVASKIAVELPRALERIDHGRIALQGHPDLEPVAVDGRDLGALGRLRRFLFDDRCQGDELPDRRRRDRLRPGAFPA